MQESSNNNILNQFIRAFDPGLGQKHDGKISRMINKDGSFNVRRKGIRHHLYQTLREMRSLPFYGAILGLYISVNVLFALIYLALGVEHLGGTIDSSVEYPLFKALFFSMQTFTTVGYGIYHPNNFWTEWVAGLETLSGWIFFAVVTGLVYGRFSRPSARLLFSNNALITPYKEGRSLQFRIVNRRKNVLLEMDARVMLMATDLSGETATKKYYNLKLETSSIHFFPISWTLVHPINESSPLFGINKRDLEEKEVEILILIKGYDETFGQNVHVRFSYKWNEVIWGARFIKNYHTSEDGCIEVDVDGVHNYEMIPAVAD